MFSALSSATDRNQFCAGDGDGGFTCSNISENNSGSHAVALALVGPSGVMDLPEPALVGGGNQDVVFANGDGSEGDAANQGCLGNGSGGLACETLPAATAKAGPHNSHSVVVGDINRDGFRDAVFANRGNPAQGADANTACFGNGAGDWDCYDDIFDGVSDDYSFAVTLGDVNADGYLDAVFGNDPIGNGRNHFCLFVPDTQRFDCANVSTAQRITTGVALADLNGDGLLDVVFANERLANRVCLNQGTNRGAAARALTFSCDDVSEDAFETFGVALGDIDNDGDPDAVFANAGVGEKNRVCLNDGDGTFDTGGCSNVSGQTRSNAVALGDMNKDGNLDAVFARSGQTDLVCPGNGNGTFDPCDDMSAETNDGNAVAPHRLRRQRVPGCGGR